MIVVVDYGMGNIQSVINALDKVDANYVVSRDVETIKQAQGIIIPGVGSFEDSMSNMHQYGLVEPILAAAKRNIPILGICLGMQILFEYGEEGKITKGLGLLPGRIVKMDADGVKIPHMGWNRLQVIKDTHILIDQQFMYFVHSYYASDYQEKDVSSYVMYGKHKIISSVSRSNVMGMQFHPEKSGSEGIELIRKWKELCV